LRARIHRRRFLEQTSDRVHVLDERLDVGLDAVRVRGSGNGGGPLFEQVERQAVDDIRDGIAGTMDIGGRGPAVHPQERIAVRSDGGEIGAGKAGELGIGGDGQGRIGAGILAAQLEIVARSVADDRGFDSGVVGAVVDDIGQLIKRTGGAHVDRIGGAFVDIAEGLVGVGGVDVRVPAGVARPRDHGLGLGQLGHFDAVRGVVGTGARGDGEYPRVGDRTRLRQKFGDTVNTRQGGLEGDERGIELLQGRLFLGPALAPCLEFGDPGLFDLHQFCN